MRLVAVVLLALIGIGCAARRVVDHTPTSAPAPERAGDPAPAAERAESLETFMAKVRKLAAEARPQRTPTLTVEGSDPELAAAIAAAALTPSSDSFRAVAEEYRRLGIPDRAHQYLLKAIGADTRDAASYDVLARVWRDWGLPGLGLAEAHRALYYAPSSPVVHNTIGTLFQALGRRREARAHYERALLLEPDAAYALNNLCYCWVLDGEGAKAVAACERALQLEPRLAAARNNLGLAFAMVGDMDASRAAFAQTGDRARGLYNLGIAHLARREYADAVSAFRDAQTARPGMVVAAARARQAETLARAATRPRGENP